MFCCYVDGRRRSCGRYHTCTPTSPASPPASGVFTNCSVVLSCAIPTCRRLVAALLPLLDWAPPNAQHSDDDDDDGDQGTSADTHTYTNTHTQDSAWRLRREELVALLAPAAAWRPRVLRTAGPDAAVQVVYDTLSFAGSAARHAAALREALLEAAASREEQQDEEDEGGQRALENRGSALCGGAVTLWSAFGAEAVFQGPVDSSMGTTCQVGPVGRHVAATAARGLPQLPPARLFSGAVDAAARLLPTSAVDQAVRALAGVLPAILRAAGGSAAVMQGAEAEAEPERGTEGGEGGWGLAPGLRELRGVVLRELGRGRWQGEAVEAAGVAVAMAVACRGAAKAVAAASASAAADGGHVAVSQVQVRRQAGVFVDLLGLGSKVARMGT